MNLSIPTALSKQELLSLMRLNIHSGSMHGKEHTIGQIDFCQETGGCAAVYAHPVYDQYKRLKELQIKHWWHAPTGRSDTDNVFSAKFSYTEGLAHVHDMTLYGRDVTSPAIVPVILQTAGQIIEDLRHHQTLPNLAAIFKDNAICTMMGETIINAGFSVEKGLHFYLPPTMPDNDTVPFSDIVMPKEVLEIFQRGGRNTLDTVIEYIKTAVSMGVSPDNRKTYRTKITTKSPHKRIIQSAVTQIVHDSAASLPANDNIITPLFNLTWQLANKGEKLESFKLAKLELFDSDVSDSGIRNKMQMLGWINTTLRRVRKGQNPELYNTLLRHNLNDYINYITTDKTIEEGGETFLVSLFGHNEKGEFRGIGDGPGECKAILQAGRDKNGKLHKLGVIQDIAFIIAAENAGFDGALPDISLLFDSVDHFTLSHMHIDHLDGLAMYIRLHHHSGMFENKHIHCKAEDARQLRQRLDQLEAKDPDLLPHIHILNDDGNFTIEKEGLAIRIEHLNALAHSAPGTLLRYICGACNRWTASIRIHADSRFDEDWIETLKERYDEWCEQGMKGVGIDRNDTYIEYDGLSGKQKGRAPRERECEENLFRVMNMFTDKGILWGQLSKNATHFITGLRLIVRTGRNGTAYGANMEETARSHNVLNIRTNHYPHFNQPLPLQPFMDNFFVQHLRDRIISDIEKRPDHPYDNAALSRFKQLHDVDDYKTVLEIQHEVNGIEWGALSSLGWQEHFVDYAKDDTGYAADLGKRLSIVKTPEELNTIRNELKEFSRLLDTEYHSHLSYFRSRTSQLGKAVASGEAEKRFMFVTFATNESATSKLFQGRGLMAADPAIKDTAIPVHPDDNVLFLVQTPNPSNAKEIEQLIRQGTELGWMIVAADNNGYTIHGVHSDKRESILQTLNTEKTTYSITNNNRTIHVSDCPIHAPGHGYQQDNYEQMKRDKPDIVNITHNNDHECTESLFENADKLGIRHPNDMFKNSEIIAIDRGISKSHSTAKSRGFIPTSYVLIKTNRPQGQFFGGYISAQKVTLPFRPNSFTAAMQAGSRMGNEAVKIAFPTLNIQQNQYKHERRERKDKFPSSILVKRPRGLTYRGPRVPSF